VYVPVPPAVRGEALCRGSRSVDRLLQRSLFDSEQRLVRAILDGRWESVANDYQVKYVVKRARAAEMLVMNLNDAPLPEIDAFRRVYQEADMSVYAF
jgi:hypothetical protein